MERSHLKHGSEYDYSKTVYTGFYNKVIIICKKHGEFLQRASDHLSGCGCKQCGVDNVKAARSLTTDSFIEKASTLHNKKYDYTNVVYVNIRIPVKIICSIHGVYTQTPSDHLNGHGCPQCGLSKRAAIRQLIKTKDQFTALAVLKHGHLYNYDEVVIDDKTKSTSKIPITCKYHGTFNQSIRLHLKGHGCARCAHEYSKGVVHNKLDILGLNKTSIVYLLKIWNDEEAFFKIGITMQTVEARFNNLPYNYSVVDSILTDAVNAFNIEQNILTKYSQNRYIPKIKFGGCSECFSTLPTQKIVDL